MQSFHSHGKLLITGEYVVLDGAKALAVPTQLGQSLVVKAQDNDNLIWQSYLRDGSVWFEEHFKFKQGAFYATQNTSYSKPLAQVLNAAAKLNPGFIDEALGKIVQTELEFEKDWGLGSSSTLLNNVANWANVNAFELSNKTFGGSGYDVAVAQQSTPILYQLEHKLPKVRTVTFDPVFKDELFFVYLNQKQNSRASIKLYKNVNKHNINDVLELITNITTAILTCNTLDAFERLLEAHETQISEIIKTPTIKSQLFKDYPKAIKSLGGWGGDFILAVGAQQDKDYFKKLGYNVIIPYSEMILK